MAFETRLQPFWEATPAPVVMDADPTAFFLSSLDRPLLEQLRERIGSVSTLRIISPFVDGRPVQLLAEWTRAQTVTLDVPEQGADISLTDALAGVPHASARATSRIEARWGPLLRLERAERDNAHDREELVRVAKAMYTDNRSSEVLRHLLRATSARKFPAIHRVGDTVCPRCHVRLTGPTIPRLHQGDAVLCDNRHILLMQD